MALPSVVTVGSAAFIVAAGVGLVAVTSTANEPAEHTTSTAPSGGTTTKSPPKPPDPKQGDKTRERDQDKREGEKPKRDRRDAVPRVFVEVYNNSGITGVAASTAAELEGAGWNVAATDNWYGAIPDNTVYFPDGMRAEAEQLAKALGYSRLRPAVAPMQFDRLTVIITSA